MGTDSSSHRFCGSLGAHYQASMAQLKEDMCVCMCVCARQATASFAQPCQAIASRSTWTQPKHANETIYPEDSVAVVVTEGKGIKDIPVLHSTNTSPFQRKKSRTRHRCCPTSPRTYAHTRDSGGAEYKLGLKKLYNGNKYRGTIR